MEITIQQQVWATNTHYLIYNNIGSVQLTVYNEPTDIDGFQVHCYISHLWVNEKHRREGLGMDLLKQAEQIAKSTGRKYVYLEWWEKDTPREVLNKFYLERGYDDVCFGRGCALLRKEL